MLLEARLAKFNLLRVLCVSARAGVRPWRA
jgi:hypothetical protein